MIRQSPSAGIAAIARPPSCIRAEVPDLSTLYFFTPLFVSHFKGKVKIATQIPLNDKERSAQQKFHTKAQRKRR